MRDIYNDTGHVIIKNIINNNPEVYDLIKHASLEDTREKIPKTAFAYPEENMYPVHSKEHAILSYAYAKYSGLKVAHVMEAIEEALDCYGVDKNIFIEQVEKIASDDYLFPEQNAYPIRDEFEVKFAEQAILPQLEKLKPETIAVAFSKLASKAEELGVELYDDSLKLAGLTVTDRAKLINELDNRKNRVKSAEAKQAYGTLIEAVALSREALFDKVNQVKLAEVIGTLDRKYGFEPFYNPIASVFNTTVKTADLNVDLGTCKTTASALSSLPLSFYSDALGSDIVAEISDGENVDVQALVQILSTLPADMKQNFAKNVQAAGAPCF